METTNKPDKQQLEAWHKDPFNWRMGFFYYNKEDKRIFPPKRYGFGWTTNFANPLSILVMFGITALIILIGLLITRL